MLFHNNKDDNDDDDDDDDSDLDSGGEVSSELDPSKVTGPERRFCPNPRILIQTPHHHTPPKSLITTPANINPTSHHHTSKKSQKIFNYKTLPTSKSMKIQCNMY